MPTTTKDSMGISTEAATQNPRRTDAVGVEIPVVVHASRNSVASREIAKPLPPVHEETRTVIVFPQGAVVRLTATMTAGELVVLTNQRSGADVLCRVASIKAQPGIQNYVDLEFTQRASGFWGDCFPSEQLPATSVTQFALPEASGSFAPSLNKPAPPQLAPFRLTPSAPAAPPPVSAAPAIPVAPVVSAAPVAPVVQAPVSAAPQAMPPVAFSTLPAMRPEPELPVAVPAAPIAPVASVTGAGMGLMRPPEQQQPWAGSFESSTQVAGAASGSQKIVLMAVAAVVLLSAIGGGVVMLRQSSAAPVASQPSSTTTQSLAPSAATVQSSSVAPQQAVPVAPAKQDPTLAARANASSSLRSEAPVVVQPSEEQPRSEALPKQPSRNSVARVVGKLSAPMIKKPASVSSSEAPPVLPASGSAGTAGAGLLLSSDPNSGPVSPAALARNTTLIGGRVLEPKLISSPAPAYPAQASLQRVQGDVVVDALVDAKGRVSEAKAISGSPLLQQAATNAVRTWKYEPARLDGEPVAAHMQVKISFHLP